VILKKILLQTTIPYSNDDWNIGSVSLLIDHLRSLTDSHGNSLYDVTARNRDPDLTVPDSVLSSLDTSVFEQLWLFALDVGEGLTPDDCAGITRFRKRGGGILSVRDHNDMGSSLCTLGGIGKAHYFHTKQPDPDESRRDRDDNITLNVDWPNYHSGANGDFQRIEATDHELFKRPDGSLIEYFPSHPHEGDVGVPIGDNSASVVATGRSKVTGRPFNLVVAFESSADGHGHNLGRAIAESSFHHFADYNWNPELGCPSFVEETPGDGYKTNPERLDDVKHYVANLAKWLSN
jgi:hypothetical protein